MHICMHGAVKKNWFYLCLIIIIIIRVFFLIYFYHCWNSNKCLYETKSWWRCEAGRREEKFWQFLKGEKTIVRLINCKRLFLSLGTDKMTMWQHSNFLNLSQWRTKKYEEKQLAMKCQTECNDRDVTINSLFKNYHLQVFVYYLIQASMSHNVVLR